MNKNFETKARNVATKNGKRKRAKLKILCFMRRMRLWAGAERRAERGR